MGSSTALLVADARNRDSAVVCLTGDDTAAIGVVAGLQQAHGASVKIGVIWIDAHGDFNTPQTSFSGILAGMPVAVLAGLAGPRWRDAAGQLAVVPTDRILIAGVRDLDNQEESLLRATAATVLDGAQSPGADALYGSGQGTGVSLRSALPASRSRCARSGTGAERVDAFSARAGHQDGFGDDERGI